MQKCPFCGAKETIQSPVCQSCGAIQYPVPSNNKRPLSSRRKKLKLSASVATALVTPGAFIVLGLIGAKHLLSKLKSKKNKSDA